jgi:hypothetical protein
MSDIAWWMYATWALIGILIGWWIGSVKGYPVLGAILGIFSVLGWVIMALIPGRAPSSVAATTTITHSDAPRPPDLPHERMPQHPPDVVTMREHPDEP